MSTIQLTPHQAKTLDFEEQRASSYLDPSLLPVSETLEGTLTGTLVPISFFPFVVLPQRC